MCADDLTVRPWRRYLAPGQRAVLGRGAAAGELDGEMRVALADPHVAVHHARLDDRFGAWVISDEGTAGGTWLDGRRLRAGEAAVLHDGALIEVGHTFLLFRPAAPCVESASGGQAPLTLCPEWELRLRSIDRLARSRQPVLIEGESGAGKEVLARMLHERSGRRGALISLNCAALPDNLLEDELFGHRAISARRPRHDWHRECIDEWHHETHKEDTRSQDRDHPQTLHAGARADRRRLQPFFATNCNCNGPTHQFRNTCVPLGCVE